VVVLFVLLLPLLAAILALGARRLRGLRRRHVRTRFRPRLALGFLRLPRLLLLRLALRFLRLTRLLLLRLTLRFHCCLPLSASVVPWLDARLGCRLRQRGRGMSFVTPLVAPRISTIRTPLRH
jgi:hypothetical protein